jgi:hypothetical protein
MDQIVYIWQILEKKWEYNGMVHQLFIDFKKAYDSIKREVLYNILPNSGQNQNIRIANESFEMVAKFKYLEMTQIRMTFIMKSRVD